MRLATRLSGSVSPVKGALAAVAAGLLTSACAVSGPSPLAETTSVKPPSASATMAAGAAASQSRPDEPAAPAPARPAPVRVVMLLPLSGAPQLAAVAKGMKQAGEMALFDLDSPSVQLVVKDDRGTPEGARTAAEEAVKEGAELILGPLLSRSVASAAPVARSAGLPIVAFSNDQQVAGSGTYLLSFLVRPEVERIVGYTVAQSRKRFAALTLGDPHGQLVDEALRAAIARHGGTIVAREAVPADAGSLVEPVQRLGEAIRKAESEGGGVDALLIPGGQEVLSAIGPLLATTGIDLARIKVIGTGGWDLPAGGRADALAGSWFAGPDPRGWRDFAERFSKTYGAPPPRLATLAYDAVGLAVALAPNPKAARFTPGNLARASGFQGIDGSFRLLPNGLSERALAVLEIQKFGINVIDPAPGSLANAQLGSPSPSAN